MTTPNRYLMRRTPMVDDTSSLELALPTFPNDATIKLNTRSKDYKLGEYDGIRDV